MDQDFSLWAWGRRYNPSNWFYKPYYLINRIYFICGGTAYYRKEKKLHKGFVYILPANPDFAVSQDDQDPVDHVYFDFYSLRRIAQAEYIEIDSAQLPSLRHIFLAAMEDFQDKALTRAVGPAYFSIITTLLRRYFDNDSPSCEVTRLAMQLIHDKNIAELTVNGIAEQIGVHVNHLIRCFHKDTGHTPHQYIAMLKVDIATDLLCRGATINQVADTLGYGSVSAFSTFFKKQRRFPPSALLPPKGK